MEDIFGSCRCHSHYRCKINPADRERESKNRLHILGYENSLQMAPQSQKKKKKKPQKNTFSKGEKRKEMQQENSSKPSCGSSRGQNRAEKEMKQQGKWINVECLGS